MPLTTTATWPDLVSGKKAKASEVEAKFDWIEGSIWPMSGGELTTSVFDLGTSSAKWKNIWSSGDINCTNLYATSLNPTSTANGIAMGTTTANANACLDLSGMPKALFLPILTTTQRGALTPSAGMIIYNSTNSRMERYEGGQWLAMNNPIGLKTKVVHSTTNEAYADALNITGAGRLISVIRYDSVSGGSATTTTSVIVDGTAYNIPLYASATNVFLTLDKGNTSSTMAYTSASENIDINFKTSLQIQSKIDDTGGTAILYITYELA